MALSRALKVAQAAAATPSNGSVGAISSCVLAPVYEAMRSVGLQEGGCPETHPKHCLGTCVCFCSTVKALANPTALLNYEAQKSPSSIPPDGFPALLHRWLMGHQHTQNLVAWPFVPPPLGVIPVSMTRSLEATAFILPPGTGIPLHDHRGMHVLSVLLSGSLTVHSATPADTQDLSRATSISATGTTPMTYATGDTWGLQPCAGNVHAFESPLEVDGQPATAPATVLEFLLPPYAAEAPCTYYQARSASGEAVPWSESTELQLLRLAGHPVGLHMLGL